MDHPRPEFMEAAIKVAREALRDGDYAIGSVIVKNGQIISLGRNRIKIDPDPTHHSEIVAIREASHALKANYLEGCWLYTTHEPCPMCAAGCVWAKLSGVVFGTTLEDMIGYRQQHGNEQFSWRTIDIPCREVFAKGEPKPQLIEAFMRDRCQELFHSS